jgi:hypothetical protein
MVALVLEDFLLFRRPYCSAFLVYANNFQSLGTVDHVVNNRYQDANQNPSVHANKLNGKESASGESKNC